MKRLTKEFLVQLCNERKLKWTLHVIQKLQERGIYRDDVFHAICGGSIIEQYPDDFPYPSCLVSGTDLQGKPLHVVVASDESLLFIITAYFPDLDRFEDDYKTRKEQ